MTIYRQKLQGIEFYFHKKVSESVYIVGKRFNSPPSYPINISLYGVVDGIIFQCPRLKQIVASRFERINHSLSECLDIVILPPDISDERRARPDLPSPILLENHLPTDQRTTIERIRLPNAVRRPKAQTQRSHVQQRPEID